MQTVSLTQKLMRMQQAKTLKEQVDVARHKEVVLKMRLQLWIYEVYIATASIKGKLAQLQETQEKVQGSSLATVVSEQRVKEVQQAATQCTTNLVLIQKELGGLRAKIYTSLE